MKAAVANLEERLNALLVARVPSKLSKRARPTAIDVTEIAYHGQDEQDDEPIRRSCGILTLYLSGQRSTYNPISC